MLVLSRKCGEKVVLPQEGICIQVLEIAAGRVRLGITAPTAVAVHREEVWQRLQLDAATPTVRPKVLQHSR